jgi:predicted ArsR family transcriptional regulator
MDGLTLSEMSKKLKIPINTLRQRITRLRIKPKTQEAIYDYCILDKLKSVPGKGRPPKKQTEKTK